ncbi:MAG: hypothetical protein PHD97_12235 [Bacteroidales bacterium]|nr:hypothetical protein [Bacteroidales bacterium]
MKKSLVLFFIIFVSCLAGKAQTERLISLQKGTVLVYEVNKNNQTYPLTITIESIEPDIVFSFNSEGTEKKSGNITINKKALLASGRLVFDFSQSKLILSDATCLFFSKIFYNKIDSIAEQIYTQQNESAESSTFTIKLDNNNLPVILGGVSKEVEEINVNGKEAKLFTYSINNVKDPRGNPVEFGTSYIFRIVRNSVFPIISYANMVTYELVLKEVKNIQWLRYNYAKNEYEPVKDDEIDD